MIYVLSGSAPLFAIIAVTYPSGSICTCGGKAAKDTSGYALFNVKAGTYTVECHTSDNSKSKSTSVTVSANDKGKSKSVMLRYELVILNGSTGNGSSNWEAAAVGNGSVSFSSYAGIVVDPNGWTPRVTSSKAWDLSDFKTLEFYISRPTNKMNIRCGVGKPHSTYGYITNWDAYTDTTSEETSFIVIVDIKNITSTYIGMEFTYGTKATISKIIAS